MSDEPADSAADIEAELVAVAKHISAKARADNCDIQDATKALKELKEVYAILTEGKDKGDKEPRRRPATMAGMKERIERASHLSVVPDDCEEPDES